LGVLEDNECREMLYDVFGVVA